jgi:hypothetical protein
MKLRLAPCVLLLCALIGCGEPGRVRVSDRELVGDYVTEVAQGKEQLTLKPDKTYVQVFSSSIRQLTNRGTWKSSDDFLGGTEVELTGATISEGDPSDSLYLQVQRENGKLKLARNEAADWYYERIP